MARDHLSSGHAHRAARARPKFETGGPIQRGQGHGRERPLEPIFVYPAARERHAEGVQPFHSQLLVPFVDQQRTVPESGREANLSRGGVSKISDAVSHHPRGISYGRSLKAFLSKFLLTLFRHLFFSQITRSTWSLRPR